MSKIKQFAQKAILALKNMLSKLQPKFVKRAIIALIGIVIAVVAVVLVVVLSNSGEELPPDAQTNPPQQSTTEYGIDNVYFMQDGSDEYLFTITSSNFLFSGLEGEQRGSFTYNSDTATLALTFNNGQSGTATIEGNVLKLEYKGNSYRMVKREYFTVTYVDGESTLSTEKVLSSAYVKKPDDPQKDGYAFVGWYADAAYAAIFDFAQTAIGADTSIYARFEALTPGMSEYTVSLIDNGQSAGTITTVNGIAYNLPNGTGENFVGWWVSDYQSGEKLTYRYTGQKLSQNTNLYAVYSSDDSKLFASVSAAGITWNSQGPNVNYRVTIKLGDTTVTENSTGETSFTYDFTTKDPGEYTITVTTSSTTATVYYKNKTLDRVSNFRVVSSGILVFTPVANAEKYYITVLCGNPAHTHEREDIGNSTNYIFSNCDMPEQGIRFVVTAVADGYMDSVSEMYVYAMTLQNVDGITIDNASVTWLPVEDAAAYYLELSTDGISYEKHYITGGTSYDITGMPAGKIYAKVTPVSAGYYSEASDVVEYTKTTLATPTGITVSGDSLTWNAVEGAAGYNVSIDGTVYTTDTNTLKLEPGMLAGGVSVYSVSVQATATDTAANSAYSAAAPINYMTMGTVSYEDGYVYWTPVVGSTGYVITIGGRTYNAAADANRYAVIFDRSGDNEISVSYLDTDYNVSNAVSITVTTYEIEFDTRGGKAVPSLFKAFGDTIVLPDSSRDGYEFSGWFTAPNGLEYNGKPYTSVILDTREGRVIYAAWSAEKYEVSLVIEGSDSSTAEVTYGIVNNLKVPENTDNTRMFYGWYTEPNGAGTRMFDENGVELNRWNATNGMSLYAYFPEILQFVLGGDEASYAVKQGAFGIGTATEITIPATYNGFPVTTVDAGAFVSCTTLEVVNIPNSVTNIELGIVGTNGTGSAFQSCSKLRAVNIYEVEGENDPVYHSVDGVLYKQTESTREIVCYPYAKTGVLIVEEGTTLIPVGVFRSSKIIEIQIPHTVTAISADAFYSCSSLQRIVFLPTPEGETEQPLSISTNAIRSCSKLESISFPARIADFQADYISSCTVLTSVEIADGNPTYFSMGPDGNKVVCTNEAGGEVVLVFCPKGVSGSYTIPNGISIIGDSAFKSCTKITELNIPSHIKEIRSNAFASCSGIEQLNFQEDPEQVLTIRSSAFYSCSGLTTLTLPVGLVTLEANAFGATTKLTSVTIHSAGLPTGEDGSTKVLNFATAAFGSTAVTPVYYVTDVTIGANVPEFELVGVFGQKVARVEVEAGNLYYSDVEGVLYNANQTAILFYPSSRVGEYVLPETVTTIGANVFNGKTGLTKITIGKNVTAIGENAFRSCTKLTDLVFQDGGTETLVIGDGAFYACSGLTSLHLPARENGIEIGNEAFRSCSKLTAIAIPEGVTKIGYGTFYACSKAVTITLPSTLTEMSLNESGVFNTFTSCAALTEIIFSGDCDTFATIDGVLYKKTDGVVTDLVFCPQYKAGSTTVTVPGTVTNVYAQAFSNNKVVTEIIFAEPETVQPVTIGDSAFSNSSTLKRIALPRGLATITAKMFYYCTVLEELVIPNTVTSIENQAFYLCRNLSSLTFEPVETPTEDNALVIENATSYSTSPFYGCYALKEVVFPERMTELGNYAFGGTLDNYGTTTSFAIESVSLPSTLTRIGNNAFSYAIKLHTVTFAPGIALSDTNTSILGIGNSAFYHCDALSTIVLPNAEGSEYSIGTSAFGYSGLTSIVIPKNVKELKASVFSYAPKLLSVSFAEGANPKFGTSIFSGTKLTSIALPEGLTTISGSMFYNCKQLTAITIPASVTKVDTSAFSGCSALASVTIATDENGYSKLASFGNNCFANTALTEFAMPTLEGTASVSLGTNVFTGCKSLTTVMLSPSVAKIENVFTGCYSINNFVVDEENENFAFDADVRILYNKDKTAFRYFCSGAISGDFVVPDTILELPAYLFDSNIALTGITIPTSVTKIGAYAFNKCYSLTSVTFLHSDENPSQLTEMGEHVFQYCKVLKNVALPGNMTIIPAYTFQYCYELESVDIPESVTEIGNYAFYQNALKTVVIPYNVTKLGNYAFGGRSSGGTITSLTFAKNPATNESALKSIGTYCFQYQNMPTIEIPNSVTTLGGSAFKYATATSITFEEGTTITQLGANVFSDNKKLISVVIPKTVKTFGNSTFDNCSSLTSVVFEEGSALTTLGTYAFQECVSLESIVIPAKVTALGNYGFDGCVSLKEITFAGNAVKTLGTYTFRNCVSLESFVIPNSITVLGTSATAAAVGSSVYTFAGCTSLKSVTLGASTKLIGGYVFSGCTALESIHFPKTVTQIGNYAFDGCSSLKSATFESGSALATIGTYAFRGAGLETFEIPAGVASLGIYTFNNCADLKTFTFAENSKLTTIGNYCFKASGLESISLPARVTSIGSYVFEACPNLAAFTIEQGTGAVTLGTGVLKDCTALVEANLNQRVVSIPTTAFYGCTSLANISLDKVSSVGSQAFRACSSLTSIELPDTLVDLGSDAFLNANLNTVYIPKALTSIGDNVFAGNRNLESFEVNSENGKYEVRDGYLFDKETRSIVSVPNSFSGALHVTLDMLPGAYSLNGVHITELIIDEGVTEFPSYAFYGATIDQITLPESLESISVSAFQTAKISSIVIPANVTSIGNSAFRNSTVKSITFAPESKLELLGTYAFSGTEITSITLPAGLTRLGSTEWLATYTFKDCQYLETVRFEGAMEALNPYSFQNCTALTDIVIPSTVRYLGNRLFEGCTALETIVIPEGIEALYIYSSYTSDTTSTSSGYTFNGCTSLKNVTLPQSLLHINPYSFDGCTALESLNIPSSVVTIGTYAFRNCTSLKTVTFGENSALEKVGNYAFTASGLESITISGPACAAANYIFKDCLNLAQVTFTGNMTAIPQYAFQNCTALKTFVIPETVTTLSAYAFSGSGLTSIFIPATVESINTSVFKDCLSLKIVEFEEGCTTVSGSMFSGCTELTSVKLASTISVFSTSAFENCTSIKALYMPAGIITLNKIFAGWTSAQTIYFACDESDSSAWTSTWADDCDAKFVWNAEWPTD